MQPIWQRKKHSSLFMDPTVFLRLKRREKKAARSCFARMKTLNHATLFTEKKIKFYFLFLITDITFAEFDRNPNFVPDYILPDVVARETKKTVVLVGCI